jgi:hypothetical protein
MPGENPVEKKIAAGPANPGSDIRSNTQSIFHIVKKDYSGRKIVKSAAFAALWCGKSAYVIMGDQNWPLTVPGGSFGRFRLAWIGLKDSKHGKATCVFAHVDRLFDVAIKKAT